MIAEDAKTLEAIRRERENLEWITKSMAWLRERFGGRYIAVRNREVIDSDGDFEALLQRVRQTDDPESVTIEFITETEYVWML